MLEAAFRGDFSESRYDESRMSALEVRMCQYLKEQEGQRRRLGRELAMLQSIGMTRKQLKKMLICEGCAYSVIAFLAALLLNLLMHALILKQLEHLLWFFLARFIWYPAFGMLAVFLVMGTLIPILAYRSVERMSIVERLRMGE